MDRTERVNLLHGLLSTHPRGLSQERLLREAGCSRASLYRDIAYMRDTLGAPIERVGDPIRLWRYASDHVGSFQLPGMWMNADELYALLLAQQMLERSGAGLFGRALGPLQPRIHKLLGSRAFRLDRLRVLRTQARSGDQTVFRLVTEAVLAARQLRFEYRARSTARASERVVSPQRLIHHRDNWYLDAWDAPRASLRRFALDRIAHPELLPEAAIDLPADQLDAREEAGYGIFAGPDTHEAVIVFTPHAARWVADERWHPRQRQRWLPDGSLELTLPYSNARELLMDVQRHGADAEILAPAELREEMRAMLSAALGRYGGRDGIGEAVRGWAVDHGWVC